MSELGSRRCIPTLLCSLAVLGFGFQCLHLLQLLILVCNCSHPARRQTMSEHGLKELRVFMHKSQKDEHDHLRFKLFE